MKTLSILFFIFSIIIIKSKKPEFKEKDNDLTTRFLGSIKHEIVNNFENKFYEQKQKHKDNKIVKGVYNNGYLGLKEDQLFGEEIYDRDMIEYERTWKEILEKGNYNEENRALFNVPSYVELYLDREWTRFTLIYQSRKADKTLLNCIFFFMKKEDKKFSMVYLIIKDVNFDIPLNIGKTRPLILFTSNSDNNILIGENKYEPFEIDETCLTDEEKDFLIQYFNVNGAKILNGVYRIDDLPYPEFVMD